MKLFKRYAKILVLSSFVLLGGLCVFFNYRSYKRGISLRVADNINVPSVSASSAQQDNNVSGYAWSPNIGWISFSSKNCDVNGNGYVDKGTCGGSDDQSTPSQSYGVSIDNKTGEISGYAWSPNIGWISFNKNDLVACPDGNCEAKIDFGSRKVSGWARACSGTINGDCKSVTNSNGWNGWIKMRGVLQGSTNEYGVFLDDSLNPAEFKGWAWGGDSNSGGIGWISFNCLNRNSCARSNYKVLASIVPLPVVSLAQVSVGSPYYCGVGKGMGLVELKWKYTDPNNKNQNIYWLQVATDSGFRNLVVDASTSEDIASGNWGTAGVKIVLSPTAKKDDFDIGYNGKYYWRVKAMNSEKIWSAWANGSSFTTKDHPYPWPQFTFYPVNPSVNQIVVFDASPSVCYDNNNNIVNCANNANIQWDLGNGVIWNGMTATTSYIYSGQHTIKLTVTSNGRACSYEHRINIGLPLPRWREVAPVGLFRKFLADVIRIIKR